MISNLIDSRLKLFRELLEYWVDYDDSTDTVYFDKSRIVTNPLREEDCYEEYQKKAEAFLKESMLRVEAEVKKEILENMIKELRHKIIGDWNPKEALKKQESITMDDPEWAKVAGLNINNAIISECINLLKDSLSERSTKR